jgi:hypothetical protein
MNKNTNVHFVNVVLLNNYYVADQIKGDPMRIKL